MPGKYSKGAQDKVEKAMHKRKQSTLKSGRSGKKVTSKKQAIAIGLSEAREEGAKVPSKKNVKKRATKKTASKKSTTGKKSVKKRATKKSTSKRSATGKKSAGKRTATKK